MKYTPMSASDLQRALRTEDVIVLFQAKSSALERMPKRPANVRFPGKKVPVDVAMVTDVRGNEVKIQDDHGFGGWVAIADGFYAVDEL